MPTGSSEDIKTDNIVTTEKNSPDLSLVKTTSGGNDQKPTTMILHNRIATLDR